ncbi:DUF4105 domain-containing protein [Bathymodiolus japonicus methanotrophic gill symbiont]|uniref:DUF4105 domain-containing protein n=1 Tax=Bathymodiolus japonicus methanotrophic gill symbiont TaxID=113269 RepID=UPI001C8E2310|nr:DUF4105 domain-containing protein [Bathymodiolus japonicus methanotrophic gill symbiont]
MRLLLGPFFYLFCISTLTAKPLHYLYINAREGLASGGHTALRFDDVTFHFQHYNGGIIRLVKQASIDFNFHYRYLDNRTIHQATVELNDDHYKQLRHYFNRHLLQQKQQDNLLNEINLNIVLLEKQAENPLLSIKGAGLFDNNAVPREIEASTIHSLHKKITQKYGAAFLSKQIQHLEAELLTLQPQPWPKDSLQLSDNSFLPAPYSFASQHIDIVSKLLFLHTINKRFPLDKNHYFIPEQPSFTLSQSELAQLTIFQNTLVNNLIDLLNSRRPDWGSAAFTLYARILSLSLTIDSGSFVFLDSFPDESYSIPYAEVNNYRTLLIEQKNQALTRFVHRKGQFFTAPLAITEKDYSRLEMLSNRYYERERGLAENHSIKVTGEQLLPTKSIPLPGHLFTTLTSDQSRNALQRLAHYQQHISRQMNALYHYDLFTRNCVTEIFSTIDKANIDDKYIHEIEQLADTNLIAFIPFGSFHSLSTNYRRLTLPSFRHQKLVDMYQQENDLLVYLREFNTLSAQDYKFNDQDSAFLFFTDDKIWDRPLLGALNLLTATTVSIYGSLSSPFDSGTTLKSGVMGMIMSLPELAFFNIRKGSYKHLSFPDN